MTNNKLNIKNDHLLGEWSESGITAFWFGANGNEYISIKGTACVMEYAPEFPDFLPTLFYHKNGTTNIDSIEDFSETLESGTPYEPYYLPLRSPIYDVKLDHTTGFWDDYNCRFVHYDASRDVIHVAAKGDNLVYSYDANGYGELPNEIRVLEFGHRIMGVTDFRLTLEKGKPYAILFPNL